ncbi:hypothetical protein ECDEC3E_1219, partial [Escherichia coli DEC3E]
GVAQNMPHKGNGLNNAVMKNFFSTLLKRIVIER